MKFIPPFGAAGNPVDITGGEPPETYRNTIALGLEDERIHSLVLGYWHTIITPPMVFAKVMAEVVEEYRENGHREADRGFARRRRRGRGGLAVPVRARRSRRTRTRPRPRWRSWRPSTAGRGWRVCWTANEGVRQQASTADVVSGTREEQDEMEVGGDCPRRRRARSGEDDDGRNRSGARASCRRCRSASCPRRRRRRTSSGRR